MGRIGRGVMHDLVRPPLFWGAMGSIPERSLGLKPPPRGHPPVAMMYQKVIQHHRKSAGAVGGTGTVPSVTGDFVLLTKISCDDFLIDFQFYLIDR